MNRRNNSGQRGRPMGFKLSEESKRAISESKKGQKHRQETRDKISKSLIIYFKNLNPLSEELVNMYCRFDDEDSILIGEWISDVCEDIDCAEDIMTIKSLRNARRYELDYGSDIEVFSHSVTPELLVLFREVCEELDVDPMSLFDDLG